ncbi:hypothetical protein [Krasilnikovia sp. MM14-A1004]|uniref:hypothetical protein n=1 Tax=Krasilnikovia sp. MM14-A1004 TaxID=3373541 RepID=UPI00399C9012
MIEHPYERSGPLQGIMAISLIMAVIFLTNANFWAEARLAAVMSFALFLVSFTLYFVTWLLHGHAAWLRSRDSAEEVNDAR